MLKELKEKWEEEQSGSAFFGEWNEIDRAIAVLVGTVILLIFAAAVVAAAAI